MMVLRCEDRSQWLDMTASEHELHRPLPGASFQVFHLRRGTAQAEFAI
jgi:putative SOS response-associated peptidase YedK